MAQTTSKKVKYVGTEQYINATTGELLDMQVTSVEERDFNFSKVWMKNFIMTLDIVGNAKTKVCFWLIDHADNRNMVIGTQRALADEIGVSYQTVNTTIKLLLDSDFLRRGQNGVYIINPDICFKGTHQARLNVLNQYSQSERIPMSPEDKCANLQKSIQALQKEYDKLQKELKHDDVSDDDGNHYADDMEGYIAKAQ